MKQRYRYRIYPKPHQLEPLAKAFGTGRVVWNDALAIYKKAFIEGKERPKNVDKIVITQAKKTEQREWLKEVSVVHLQQSFRDLQQAWANFFNSKKGKRKGRLVGCPKFKKRQSKQAIRFTQRGFTLHSKSVKIAKIGHIPIRLSRPLPNYPTSVTIIKDCANRYFASFVVEVNSIIKPAPNKSVGIDLGLSHFAITSDGEKIDNPRYHKKLLKRIKRKSKKLSRCLKGSKRRQRVKLKLAKLHAQIKDYRTDFLHKLTTRLVCENQAIAIEDLAVGNMVKNRKLSRAISDAGWYSFRRLLTAKCDKYGRQLVVINRWEATSQKCSKCGFKGGKKELNVREWTCLNCNTWHDRDICAAENIKVAGGLSETLNERGRDCQTMQPLMGQVASSDAFEPCSCVARSCEPLTTPIQLTLF